VRSSRTGACGFELGTARRDESQRRERGVGPTLQVFLRGLVGGVAVCERDNVDARFDHWAIFPDYESHADGDGTGQGRMRRKREKEMMMLRGITF